MSTPQLAGHINQATLATVLGQGKNTWQAKVDAASALDFFHFSVKYVEELYAQQPPKNMEIFVLAVSPFNWWPPSRQYERLFYHEFYILNEASLITIISNTVIWNPSLAATYFNYLVYQILVEAGITAGVIQFVLGLPPEVTLAAKLDKHKEYPRISSQTGGKNFHVIHKLADIQNAVLHNIQGNFEY
ncbi:hypothetical protein F4604DRAFT_1876625 [Suillus subluteus]|nr:hypothetical protein F4604DRAFT_1876625 [Suillus subluteus]